MAHKPYLDSLHLPRPVNGLWIMNNTAHNGYLFPIISWVHVKIMWTPRGIRGIGDSGWQITGLADTESETYNNKMSQSQVVGRICSDLLVNTTLTPFYCKAFRVMELGSSLPNWYLLVSIH